MFKTQLYKNKYRTDSMRLEGYDYSKDGAYFVTINTKNKVESLAKAKENKIVLSNIGKIAYKNWLEIPKHFPFVFLDEFIIMPNHVHGIIFINKESSNVKAQDPSVQTQDLVSVPLLKEPEIQPYYKNTFGPQSRNLASIIRGYKASIAKYATINNIPFKWQSLFYDHIIRTEDALYAIREYIVNNPAQWIIDQRYKTIRKKFLFKEKIL